MLHSNYTRTNRKAACTRRKLATEIAGRLVSLPAFLVVLQCMMIADAHAQQHSSHMPTNTAAPLVDGSVQPELIPDDVAIRLLMKTLRLPANPDAESLNRLSVRIARANFSSSDMQILIRELGILDTQATRQEMLIKVARPFLADPESAAFARYLSEQERLRAMMINHYQSVLAALSPEGQAKLRQHLRHVKSRIKIYPMPEMSGATD